jgi:hypothetical protein
MFLTLFISCNHSLKGLMVSHTCHVSLLILYEDYIHGWMWILPLCPNQNQIIMFDFFYITILFLLTKRKGNIVCQPISNIFLLTFPYVINSTWTQIQNPHYHHNCLSQAIMTSFYKCNFLEFLLYVF